MTTAVAVSSWVPDHTPAKGPVKKGFNSLLFGRAVGEVGLNDRRPLPHLYPARGLMLRGWNRGAYRDRRLRPAPVERVHADRSADCHDDRLELWGGF